MISFPDLRQSREMSGAKRKSTAPERLHDGPKPLTGQEEFQSRRQKYTDLKGTMP
jgi:hypothetical protein